MVNLEIGITPPPASPRASPQTGKDGAAAPARITGTRADGRQADRRWRCWRRESAHAGSWAFAPCTTGGARTNAFSSHIPTTVLLCWERRVRGGRQPARATHPGRCVQTELQIRISLNAGWALNPLSYITFQQDLLTLLAMWFLIDSFKIQYT